MADAGGLFDDEGFLRDADAWTRELAEQVATELGVAPLTEAHWTLIDWARADFAATGVSPNVRRLGKGSGVGTKTIYQLFPRAPGKAIARVAGLPKPAGCI